MYTFKQKKINAQFKYAGQNNIPYGLFIHEEKPYTLRELSSRTDSTHHSSTSIAATIHKGL